MKIKFLGIKFEKRDWWFGLYYEFAGIIWKEQQLFNNYRVYICIIPTFPIIFSLYIKAKPKHKKD